MICWPQIDSGEVVLTGEGQVAARADQAGVGAGVGCG